MGVLDWLGVGKRTGDLLSSSSLGMASPFADGGNLQSVVLSDIFGTELVDSLPLTRAEAVTIPAVYKARNLILTAVGKLPLVALSADGTPAEQPSWMYRTDTAVNAYQRMQWTVDDCIFYGMALWEVERGAAGQITKANFVPSSDWNITEGHILVREQQVDPSSYIFFNHVHEGLLNVANRTLKGARDIERIWVARVKDPIPTTVITHTEGDTNATPLEQHEIDALLTQWRTARRAEGGTIGYLPPSLQMTFSGETKAELFVEGRNASRTDIGSFLNIPVAMLDGTIGVDSLTYSTAEGTKNRFYEETLPFWIDTIAHRLSDDDVVPRGQRVRFDKTEVYALLPNPTDAPTKD